MKCQHCDADILQPNRMGTTPEMQKMYDEFGGETVTDEMVEIAWAAIVGNDIAKTCFNASIIRADLKTGLTAALAATPAVGGEARKWIIDLIHNSYDPAPPHYKLGDNWDDGTEEIADQIIARLAQPASPLRGRDKALEPFLNFAKCIPDNVDDARGMACAGFAVAMGTSASLSAGNFRDLLSASIPGLSLRGSMQDELLNAAQPLFDNITRMIQCLADANWRPSRAHIEGARNTMQQAAATLGRIAASPTEQPAADPVTARGAGIERALVLLVRLQTIGDAEVYRLASEAHRMLTLPTAPNKEIQA